ncbi:MAG: hypothetical protein ACRCVT_14880, partial [Leadbetterella sp.]
LKTAEDTTSKMSETAQIEANAIVDEAKLKAAQIIEQANLKSSSLLSEVEAKSASIQSASREEYLSFEKSVQTLEKTRKDILVQLASISEEAAKLANMPVPKVIVVENVQSPTIQKVSTATDDSKLVSKEIVEDEVPVGMSFASSANTLSLDKPEEVVHKYSDFEIIEGIGPKIKEVLYGSRIYTFRDLAITPIYRLKDLLTAAGPHFASHDPSSWGEQAILAESGEWEKLEALKKVLVGGRLVEKEPSSLGIVPDVRPQEASSTEDMLEKVNKVKAAIRRSMIDKADSQPATSSSSSGGGSFFDNLNL